MIVFLGFINNKYIFNFVEINENFVCEKVFLLIYLFLNIFSKFKIILDISYAYESIRQRSSQNKHISGIY